MDKLTDLIVFGACLCGGLGFGVAALFAILESENGRAVVNFFLAGFLCAVSGMGLLWLNGDLQLNLSMFLLLALLAGVASVLSHLLYFLPTVVAVERDHPYPAAILALNFLLGWTFLGWIAALAWACITPATKDAGSHTKHSRTNTHPNRLRTIPSSGMPDEEKAACTQCGRQVARAFLCSDGRCQKCYQPVWS